MGCLACRRRDGICRLPAIALAMPIAAAFERLQSQSMADAVQQPFVAAAVARGVPPRDLILRHAWPVSLRPLCAVYGLVIGALLSGRSSSST
jgi:ABC-type dipeptide/oligopeptide/nickel transport system permease component